ncbi:MAG TPA: L-rhamnose isomerase [Bacteroidales bacterium]|nr:L-rhamnose isomerase [Bacteroidales bacterium]
MTKQEIIEAYAHAREQYAVVGVDTDAVLDRLDKINISMHCWQTDDVSGFETPDAVLGGGGIQATGNYPGKARTIEQLKMDIEKVMSLLPGKQRLSLHAIYGDFKGKKVDRDEIDIEHFQGWIEWAKKLGIGLDFNPTCFSHQLADDGFTLSSKNEEVRKFWIEHNIRCRKIAAEMGRQLGTPCINNIWIPDGSKDVPVDRFTHRKLLMESLDEIFKVKYYREYIKDSIECKLFGIGYEAMTVGSAEFYIGYGIKNNLLITLDNGHFHPTEQVEDKISSLLLYVDELLLHLTRGIRWDSDHVVILNDEIISIAQEIVRCNVLHRVNVGLDYFDASLNRIGAYVIGVRAAQMAFLNALLEPTEKLREYEEANRFFERLALMEILKTKPLGLVYNYYCMINDVPVGEDYIAEIQEYENRVLKHRN